MPSIIQLNSLRWLSWVAASLLFFSCASHAQQVKPWPPSRSTPELSLTDTQGKEWRLSALRGKPVVINFWASWCEPCRHELSTLQTFSDLYGSQVTVLAVNLKERDDRVARFLRAADLNLPAPMDRDGSAASNFGVKVYPSSIVIGPDGRARWFIAGEIDWSSPVAGRLVEPLLK